MPTKNINQRSTKQRRRRTNQLTVLRNYAPFPRVKEVIMRYTHTGLYAESAAGTGFQGVWALNGLYDMDVTNPGHQPMYYDELLTINGPYARYTVHHVDVVVEVNSTTTSPIVAGFYVQPGVVDFPSLIGLQEKPMGQTALLAQSPVSGCRRVFRFTVDIKKVFGVNAQKLNDDDTYSGLYNANPAQVAYMIVMIYGVTTIAAATVKVNLVPHAKLFSLVAAPTS